MITSLASVNDLIAVPGRPMTLSASPKRSAMHPCLWSVFLRLGKIPGTDCTSSVAAVLPHR